MERSGPIGERMVELIIERFEKAEIIRITSEEMAAAFLMKEKPAVLFLDIKFPVNSLVLFITSCKEWCPSMQIVVMYILRDEVLLEKCRNAGVQHFLDKYEQFDQVVEILNDIFSTQEQNSNKVN